MPKILIFRNVWPYSFQRRAADGRKIVVFWTKAKRTNDGRTLDYDNFANEFDERYIFSHDQSVTVQQKLENLKNAVDKWMRRNPDAEELHIWIQGSIHGTASDPKQRTMNPKKIGDWLASVIDHDEVTDEWRTVEVKPMPEERGAKMLLIGKDGEIFAGMNAEEGLDLIGGKLKPGEASLKGMLREAAERRY